MTESAPKIFITRSFPGPGIEMLKERYDVGLNRRSHVLPKWQLKRAVRGVDVIVSLLTDKIDAPVMDAAGSQLKLIANYAVGFDNVDIKAAKERDILVTNTPDVLTQAVAEHTFALAITAARRIVEADRFARAGRYHQWEPELLLGIELAGKTLGIIGLGRIGGLVAQMAQGFGMETIYYDVHRNKKLEREYRLTYHEFETVLKQADIISLHVPLLPTTHHLIGAHEFSLMKKTAVLVNTARGPVVSEKALIQALRRGQIFGAGLDVFEFEPHISGELRRLPNVVITPHIASATKEAREAMGEVVAKNVIAVLEDGKPINPVY